MIRWRLETFDELNSTSDFCTGRAKENEAEGLAVLAITQTAGRGSRGRHWLAATGNLNLSVLLRPSLPAAEAGIFALLAGLATAEALRGFLPPNAPIMLKWPNDLLLAGAKCGGILIDAAPAGTQLDWLVIGIGINLRSAPAIAGRATTSLKDHHAEVSAATACTAVLESLNTWLNTLAGSGAAPVQQAWLSLAHPIGTDLKIQTAGNEISGTFAGLSPSCELLLNTENRIQRVNTGEILLGSGGPK